MTDVIDLSVCIVNHATPDLTRACVASVAAAVGRLAVEILVANNTRDPLELDGASPGGVRVTIVQNEQPLGFSANQNGLLARGRGRYLMALNSDTLVHAGALEEIVSFMDGRPRCGLAGPRLVYGDGRLQPSCRNFPDAANCFAEASSLWRLLRPGAVFRGRFALLDPHDVARRVDWLSGACLVVRRAAGESAGYFNTELFPGMYGEDLEWAWRLRRAGWEVWFDPAATVTHLESRSPVPDRAVRTVEGMYRFCRAYYNAPRRWGVALGIRLGYAPKWLLASDAQRRAGFAALIRLRM